MMNYSKFGIAALFVLTTSTVHAQQYLVGAYLFAANARGATTFQDYQYDTNSSDPAQTLSINGAGKNISFALSNGNNVFSFDQTYNLPLSTYGSNGDLGLFFSSTNTPYDATSTRTPDLLVSYNTNGATTFFTPVAGTSINDYHYVPNEASIFANGATTFTIGSSVISVSAYRVADKPDGSFTLSVTPSTATPEPGSVALLCGLGICGIGLITRRRKAKRPVL